MKAWILRSLRKGIVTTKFPSGENETVSPWSTIPIHKGGDKNPYCPSGAIKDGIVIHGSCISCGMCSPSFEPSMDVHSSQNRKVIRELERSIKIYAMDSGSCGACNLEIMALSSPQYDGTRLGITFTNTPRQADALMISGILTEGMKDAVLRAFESMAEPRVVFATGTCAISGGILGKSVSTALNTDVIVPGCPPDPFVIINAIQKLRGMP
ncbi:MAG: NADH:ubiquinone oxidoreductase [Thermoplasmatales archaeon]|nr:NADH:ubiquinone oxidoreductase [Thermoplasmatales archaeon]